MRFRFFFLLIFICFKILIVFHSLSFTHSLSGFEFQSLEHYLKTFACFLLHIFPNRIEQSSNEQKQEIEREIERSDVICTSMKFLLVVFFHPVDMLFRNQVRMIYFGIQNPLFNPFLVGGFSFPITFTVSFTDFYY